MKRMITDETVAREFAAGIRRIHAPPSTTVVTPAAWSKARELGLAFDGVGTLRRDQEFPAEGRADRVVDASGVIVVRGSSVQLGRFTGAGSDRNIGLLDLVTGRDGAPMTAGIMSFGRDDSFPWSLDYHEIDLVLEGSLHIHIDGRILEGSAGDVLSIPKGSKVVFATPGHVRVFYVTHPADWAGGATRPQK